VHGEHGQACWIGRIRTFHNMWTINAMRRGQAPAC